MAITDAEAARQMAEQYPDLHESRQIAFGQNYLQDLEQGKGTAQYYTGFGLVPDWVTGAIGAPATTPVVQEPTAGDAQVAEQIAAQDRDAEITGASVVQPTGGEQINVDTPLTQMITDPVTGQTQTVKQAMTSPEAYNIPGEMPKTPAEGMVWGPQEQFQPEISDPFLMSGAAGGARLPQIGFGEGKVDPALAQAAGLTTDYPGSVPQNENYWQDVQNVWNTDGISGVATKFGRSVADTFTDLKNKGIDVGQIAIGSLMNMVQPGLGLLSKAIPKDTSEDTWNRQFALGGEGFQDIATSDPDLGKRLEGYGKDLIAGTGEGKDPFGRNTVSMFGDYEKALAEDLQYTGDNQFNLDKKAYAQAYFNKKGIGLNPNEAKAFEEKYGISLTGEPVTRDRIIDEGIAAADEEDDMFVPESIPGEMPKAPAPGMEWGPFEYLQPEEPVTGAWDEGKWGPGPKIYQDRIMDIADERKALQEELEDYRDPIMDMEPAESVDLGNPLKDPRIVPEEWETEGAPWTGYRDPIMDMVPEDDTMPENLGLQPYESWMDYEDRIIAEQIAAEERAAEEARIEAERRRLQEINAAEQARAAEAAAIEQARAQREMQEQIAAAEAMEAARQAEIDRQNREAAAAAAARQRARDAAATPSGEGAGAGGGSQQATSGGGFSSGWGGGWGWSKGGIVSLKNGKR